MTYIINVLVIYKSIFCFDQIVRVFFHSFLEYNQILILEMPFLIVLETIEDS